MIVYYIGNFTHPWCTEVHLAREMRSLGHDVHEFQEPHPGEDKLRFLGRLEQRCLLDEPDLVMFTRTWGLPVEANSLWRRLKSIGITTCSYHLDLYVGLQREAGIDNDPFWTTEYVFTPDGDPKSQEFFAAKGINHYWLSPAVVSDELQPGSWDARFDYDVVFVGSYGYHTEWPWRPALIDYLADRYGPRFKRFGGDVDGGPVRGKQLNDLYATARVVVGDSLRLPGHKNYWSDRYFETIGRGGFLIAPWIDGLDDFLTDGVHYVSYDHPLVMMTQDQALVAVGERVDRWLDAAARREQIRTAGQAHVAAHHTYKHRLQQAFDIMFPPHGVRGEIVGEAAPPIIVVDDLSNDRVVRQMADVMAKPIRAERLDDPPVGSDAFIQRNALGDVMFATIDRLELGSGYQPTAGFTHLDINPNAPDVDIVGPAWPLDLPDGSVGEIRAVDVLEHMSYWDTDKILADWFRVLRPGGTIYIQVPDAELIMDWFARAPHLLVERLPANLPQTPLAGATWRLLGGHMDDESVRPGDDWRFNAHYALFSMMSLTNALLEAGFVDVNVRSNPHPNLLCNARKP